MNALRILALCVSAAIVCTSIRALHPQMASAVALASGIGALMLSLPDIRILADAIGRMDAHLPDLDDDGLFLLKMCGVALIAEFASDICRDSGEAALAKRIDTGTKIALLAASVPLAAGMLDAFNGLLA